MKLAEFAAWALREGPFDGCDLDGFDVQEQAVKCGLLKEKHGESEWDSDPWYEFSDELKAAIEKEK